MAHVVEGVICHPRVYPAKRTIPVFVFPAEASPHFPTPEGWKARIAEAPQRQVNSLPMTVTWRITQLSAV